jgi:oligoribonuclease NrnB/cAMP/cGMP phosphodiesterase (DHH superfamily)
VDFKFKTPFVLVDFMYHPKAAWWFDHHETSFIHPAWKEKYNNDDSHAFDPSFKSGCGLTLAYLKKKHKYKVPEHIEYLVRWGDVIDSAGYKNAKQIVERKEPALQLMLFLDSLDRTNQRIYQTRIAGIIKQLATKSIGEIINQPVIARKIKKYLADARMSAKIFKKLAILKNKVVFIDKTNNEISGSHFLAFYLYPKSFYSVSVSKFGGYYHVSAGDNPWNRVLGSDINIGEIMKKYGGGGHKGVGGLERKSKKEIMKIAEEIIEYLNKHG